MVHVCVYVGIAADAAAGMETLYAYANARHITAQSCGA